MFNVQLATDTTLYVSQIIDNLHDLAQYFGADTEEMVNYAQRHFKSSHRQWEWLTVRAMLRHALGPDARIEYEESGKPILKFNAQLRSSRERQSSMFNGQLSMVNGQCSMVSISHSKSHAALLLSPHSNIGVDIEQVNERILRLADRIAQPDELPSDWQSLTPEQQARHLTTLWTIKEALYKSLDHQDGVDLLKLSIPQSFDKVILNGQLQSSRENFIGGRAVSKKQGCFLGAGRYKEVREQSGNPAGVASGSPVVAQRSGVQEPRERSVNVQWSIVNCQSLMVNGQLQSSRENLHLLSAKPVQILQASSRAKRQWSMVNVIDHSSNLIAVVTPDING